jgi:hypothetical protein
VSDERPPGTHPTIQQAVAELQQLIAAHFPDTTFEVGPGGDDPDGTYIVATVDLDDPDEVSDLVIDHVVAFQVDHGLPINVVPIRTPERILRMRRQPELRQYLSVPAATP